MHIRIWIYLRNNGDGTVCPLPFPTKQLAEDFGEEDTERFEDDIVDVWVDTEDYEKRNIG
jgi:hypothetical protein